MSYSSLGQKKGQESPEDTQIRDGVTWSMRNSSVRLALSLKKTMSGTSITLPSNKQGILVL
jgi:hypothetical protein